MSLLIKNNDVKQFKGNWNYLVGFISIMIMSGMQIGYTLSCMNSLEEVFEVKFNIRKKDRDFFQSLFGSSGILGLAIGSQIASYLMKIGRKNTLLISSTIGLVGVCIEMIEAIPIIVLGRTIYGIAAGIYSVCVGRYVEETVPH